MVEGVLVFGARVGGVASESCDGVSDVGTCPQHEVHEGTKGLLEMFDVCLR